MCSVLIPEEHFLKIVSVDRTDAATIADSIKSFLDNSNLLSIKIRAIGLDGAAAMCGVGTGVQARLRYHSPMATYIHCRCHQLQLACVYAAKSVNSSGSRISAKEGGPTRIYVCIYNYYIHRPWETTRWD